MRRRYMGGKMVEYTLTLVNIGGSNIQVYVDDVFVGNASGGLGISYFTWRHTKYSKNVTVSLKQTEVITSSQDVRTSMASIREVSAGDLRPTIWIANGESAIIKDISGCSMCDCMNNVLCRQVTTYTPRTSFQLYKGNTTTQVGASYTIEYTLLSNDGSSEDYVDSVTHNYSGELYELRSGVEFCNGYGNITINTDGGNTYYINVS